jgi:eukaryotic-like serine/threonine-protein kinase
VSDGDAGNWADTLDLKKSMEAPTIVGPPRDAMSTINPLTEEACFTVEAQQYTIRDYEEKEVVFPWPDGLSSLPTVDISRGSHTESQGDFHVTNLLGRGGMGVVEHANQQSLDRGVAIKRLANERTDPRNVTALLHEAMITGSLEHPNIIPIHLLGLDQDKHPVMVMKKAEGLAWSALLHGVNDEHWKNWRGDRLERHVQILIQVCNAVHFAHTRGVIHRDIKPANIMVGDYGETYLLDWGVATKVENYDESDNRIWGTPAYMAPEMASGKQVNAQTDVFLLGSCLHEILTGFPRYRGRTARESLKLARAAGSFVFDSSVSPELATICNKACSKEREKRYQSAQEMREALTTFLRERTMWELLHVANQRVDALQELLRSVFSKPGTPVMPEKNYVIFKLFNESRFGFEQVLTQVPEHKAATTGLQRCLEAMFMYAIDQRNADFAASLVTDMPWQRPDLTQKLDELQESLASDSQALLRLEALRHDQDMKISSSQRATVFGGAMLTLSFFMFGLEAFSAHLSQTQQLVSSIFGIGLIGFVTLGITLLNRDIFLLNQVNRSLTGTLLAGFFALSLSRALSLNSGVAMDHIWQSDLLICLLIGILSGLSIRKVFFMPSLIIALVFLMALIMPELGKHALPVGLLFTSFFTLRSGRKSQ